MMQKILIMIKQWILLYKKRIPEMSHQYLKELLETAQKIH